MVHLWKLSCDGTVTSAVELPPFKKEVIALELIDVLSKYERERGSICLLITFYDDSRMIYLLSEDFESIKCLIDILQTGL